jgi:hypothetical protein
MIAAREVIYAFRQYYDRYEGQRSPSLNIIDQCFHIDQAIQRFIETSVKLAETNSLYRNDLRILERKFISFKKVEDTKDYVVVEYPDDYLKLLRASAYSEKSGCGSKIISTTIAQSDDLNYMLSNTHWKPSFGWEQAIADEADKGLYVWSNGDFEIKEVVGDYYRKHIRFDCPSLAKDEKYFIGGGTKLVTKDTGIELPSNTLHKIIQIATILAQTNQNNASEVANQIRLITTI